MLETDIKRIKTIKRKELSEGLRGMFLNIKGSPEFIKSYNQYRKAAKLLAQPIFKDSVLRSRIQIKD